MKLIKDLELNVFAIMVDYYMFSEETNSEYKEPMYVSIDTDTKDKDGNSLNLITFNKHLTSNTRIFDDVFEAGNYIDSHFKNSCCCENARVVELSLEDLKWMF